MSDLITPHCVRGSLTSGRSCGQQDRPDPPGPFFIVELAHPRVPLSLQTTQISKDNKRGAGETADRATCMTCRSFYKHKAERGSWTPPPPPPLSSSMSASFSYSGSNSPQHLESTSQTSTSLRVVTAVRIRKDPKKKPLDKVSLQKPGG